MRLDATRLRCEVVEQRCGCRRAGSHRVRPNAVATVFRRHRFHQIDDARFGGRVTTEVVVAADTRA